jgi:hypothetical protein
MNQFNLSIIIAIESTQYAHQPIIFDSSLNINSHHANLASQGLLLPHGASRAEVKDPGLRGCHHAIILVNNYNLLLTY